MTTTHIEVLLVGDSADDADLMLLELRRAGYHPTAERVDTAAGFRAALAGRAWEVILCDASMPTLDAQETLRLLRESGRDVPLVVVAGTTGEEDGVVLMRAGAADFVMKGSLGRLAPAVDREIRQAAERRERRRAAAQLAAVVESSDDAILCVTFDGIITSWNPGAERIYGWTAAEAVGRHLSFLIPPESAAEPGEVVERLERLRRGERVPSFETVRLRRDGTRIAVSLTTSPVWDADGRLVGTSRIARDITQRKQAEQELRQASDLLRAVADGSPDAVFVKDTAGKYLLFNPAAARFVGKPAAEVLGQDDATLFGPADARRVMDRDRRVMETGEAETDEEVLTAAGVTRVYEATKTPYRDGHGRVIGVIGISRDITERKRAEEALHANEERYRTVVEDQTEVVCRVRADGTFLFVNDALCRLVGKPADDLLGRPGKAVAHPDDASRVGAALATLSPDNPVVRVEHRVLGADGRTRWMEFVNRGVFGPGGGLVEFQAVGRDVTARREAEDALRESEARLVRAQAVANVGSWETDLSTMEVAWSAECYRIFGVSPDQMRPTHQEFLKLVHPDDRAAVDEAFCRSLGHCSPCEIVHRIVLPDGTIKVLEEHWQSQSDGRGKPVRVVGTCQDITQHKQAEDAIRFSEERYRSLADAMPQIVWTTNPDGYPEFLNRQWYDYTGLTIEESKGDGWAAAFHPDDRPLTWDRWRHSLATGDPFEIEYRCRRRDGEYRWFLGRTLPQRDAGGKIVRWFGTCTDIHDFKQLQADRDAALARLDLQIERMPLAYMTTDADFKCTRWNPAAERTFGFPRAEVLGRDPVEVLVAPTARPLVAGVLDRLRAGDAEVHGTNENVTKDGRVITCEWHNIAMFAPDGAFEGYIALAQDVTDGRAAEAATARLAAIVESSDDAIIGTALDGEITSWNAGAERLYGYAAAEAVGRHYSVLVPPDKEGEAEAVLSRVRRGEAVPAFETIRLHKSGRGIDVTVSVSPIRDKAGRVVGASKIARDVTRTKVLEEQFRQAQKMDAVGRLAAGVAHDFNNLLTVINGYGEIVHAALPSGHPSRELVAEIKKAGGRAAGLTRQLLAFSRQSVLEPRVLDPNALVRDLEKMLRRLLGEDVDLGTRLAPDVGRVKADPGQLEQAIVNLCVNARDAMPTGGSLTVETRDADLDDAYAAAHPGVRPGPHVLIAVADTGTGMTPEVQARIFEPFFTTKEQGKGTGLGLAMVFGFVKQSGGHVAVYSEPGRGTTFKLYLPQVADAPLAGKSGVNRTPMPRGTETVLLVEDEDAVRALSRHVLALCGYTVLEAGNGREAVRLADGHVGPLHLLLTDVVMPGGMGGRQVAEAVVARYPAAKVLFTSGYTDDAVVRHGVLEAGVHFLQKPFNPAALAQKVRDVLDGEG